MFFIVNMNFFHVSNGFQLLVRGKGGVFLTENGERLIDIMRGIINLENKLTQTVDKINGFQAGTLRIGSFL